MSEQEKREVIRAEIRKVVSQRPMRENIHEFVILPSSLSPEDGTLTRTMKIRRQVIVEKYKAELTKLYALLK
jgi:long-subunit acyl-CoA synthetase (AMP-forming)